MENCAFVIGCTGQDGSYLTKSLLQKGFKVIGISRSKVPNLKNHKKLSIDNQLEIISNELKSIEEFIILIDKYQPAEIYHLSAQSSVGLSFQEPHITFQSIVQTTNTILESCRLINYKGRVFFAGSSEIFGSSSKARLTTDDQNGVSPYAVAKKQSILQADMYREIYGLKVVTGILFNHESPLRDERFVTQKIVKGAINALSNKNSVLKLGNINVFRDWGWAEEYVEAMQLILRADNLKNYIICTGEKNSLESFVKKVFKKLGLNYKDYTSIDENLSRKFDVKISFGDPEMLREDLGWEAKNKFENIIEDLVEAQLKNKKLN